uniref:Uncharacterized protein n=1 Tax=Ditylenchus dipsaci TaxID=166011 RepID=A0A915E9L7_9BILA
MCMAKYIASQWSIFLKTATYANFFQIFYKITLVDEQEGGYQHGFENTVFIIPGIVVVLLVAFVVYKLRNYLNEKKLKEEKRQKKRELKKKS